METLDTAALITEFKLSNSGDNWGTCMQWLFAIADEIHFRRDFDVPGEWEYRPSMMGPCSDDADLCETLKAATDEALQEMGAKLWRLRAILKARGKDY